jgi:hypothetical protein
MRCVLAISPGVPNSQGYELSPGHGEARLMNPELKRDGE